MKRLIALIAAAMLLLTGCAPSVRLSQRDVVQTLGLDYADGNYVATISLYGLPGAQENEGSTITAKGETLTRLFSDASVAQGKQLFLGNLRLLVLGRSLAQRGIGSALEFLNENQQMAPSTYVVAVQGAAGTLVRQGGAAGELSQALLTAQKSGVLPPCTLLDLLLERDQMVPVLALAQAEREEQSKPSEQNTQASSSDGASGKKAEEPPEKKVVAAGAVLFSGGKSVLSLTPEATHGYCLLTNKGMTAAIETQEPLTACALRKALPKITLESVREKPVFRVRCTLTGTLLEAPEGVSFDEIARAQERLLTREVQQFFAVVYRRGYDPLELAAYLPAQAVQWEDDARQALRTADYEVEIKCEVEAPTRRTLG